MNSLVTWPLSVERTRGEGLNSGHQFPLCDGKLCYFNVVHPED